MTIEINGCTNNPEYIGTIGDGTEESPYSTTHVLVDENGDYINEDNPLYVDDSGSAEFIKTTQKDLLELILLELRKVNTHLSMMTNAEIKEGDVL